ncbi:MAG: hypothetical protein KGJ86_12280 [Chloroflexota bacterium]|nr:hypothetical protein [Chloroflexota bacterium]
MPGSTVFFGQTPTNVTYDSPTQLSADIPTSLAAAPPTSACFNGGPGGGASSPVTFFLTQPGVLTTAGNATSTSATSVASASVGGTAPYGPGSLNGQAFGKGTLTLAQYSANPVAGAPTFGFEGGWFDLHVSPDSSFSVVVVTNCNLGSGHEAFWWTGSAWQVMSNQNWNPNNGCLTIRFDQTTSPTISQLNGTEAEILGWAQGIGLPVCIGDEFAGDHGGRLPQSLDELDSWGNNKGLRNPSTTAWSCSPSLAAPQSQPSGPGWYQRSDGIIIQGWDDMDSQLRGAGYPGPYDHDGEETAAYERACLCTLTVYVPPPPVVCSSGYYMTINGPKTVDQMRSELRVAGYPNWQWAGEAEIVSVYARVSGGAITLCASGNPQPGPATPTPPTYKDPADYAVPPSGCDGSSGLCHGTNDTQCVDVITLFSQKLNAWAYVGLDPVTKVATRFCGLVNPPAPNPTPTPVPTEAPPPPWCNAQLSPIRDDGDNLAHMVVAVTSNRNILTVSYTVVWNNRAQNYSHPFTSGQYGRPDLPGSQSTFWTTAEAVPTKAGSVSVQVIVTAYVPDDTDGSSTPCDAGAPVVTGVIAPPVLIVDASTLPNIARHEQAAIAAHPEWALLHYEPDDAIAESHREAACAPFTGLQTCDEYPFAHSKEGGAGASIADISIDEQRRQGGYFGNFVVDKNMADGDAFREAVVGVV